ncbi:hypothetical protein SCP_0805100 [Sparassis crispa]|uniref:Uncharacterized protein n=1 Tax=Sparassis crispa TaxID=139825 RepID=A0A401GUV8_9APHY|nr:hypothetical protein SCP_0805100 [Sparassis crispa]GBE85986.1 hypothetical protein SCP_0805100 [Sparassis crispa]
MPHLTETRAPTARAIRHAFAAPLHSTSTANALHHLHSPPRPPRGPTVRTPIPRLAYRKTRAPAMRAATSTISPTLRDHTQVNHRADLPFERQGHTWPPAKCTRAACAISSTLSPPFQDRAQTANANWHAPTVALRTTPTSHHWQQTQDEASVAVHASAFTRKKAEA